MGDAERLKLEGSLQALRVVVAVLLAERARENDVQLSRLHEVLCRIVENVQRDRADPAALAASDTFIAETLRELDMVFSMADGLLAGPDAGK